MAACASRHQDYYRKPLQKFPFDSPSIAMDFNDNAAFMKRKFHIFTRVFQPVDSVSLAT